MDRMSRFCPSRGLTLLEVLVVLALLAVLTVLVIPGFHSLQQALFIRLEAGSLLQAAALARSEAMARGQPVTLCPAAPRDGTRSRCSGDYSQGWLVYANPLSLVQPAGPAQVLRRWPSRPGLRVVNRAGTDPLDSAVTWRPDGSARRNLTFMVCSRASPGLASWSLVLNRLGRPRLARAWGECDGPA